MTDEVGTQEPTESQEPRTPDESAKAPQDTGAETPTTQEEALRKLRSDAADPANARSGEIINQLIDRVSGLSVVNLFQGDFAVAGDLVAAPGTRSGRRGQQGSRGGRQRIDPDLLTREYERYVAPADFQAGCTLLQDNNIVLLSGPARTGRRTRALATLMRVMADVGTPQEIHELSGPVLGNMSWRAPRAKCGFLLVDRQHGKPAAAGVEERWLQHAADQLREQRSYLVVVTGPVQGALASAANRAEFVLDDMELPDPLEIVRKQVLAECPWLTDQEFERRCEGTALTEILDSRDNPAFATRAANKITDALRNESDLAAAIAALRDPEQEVREWLSTDPDAGGIAFTLAAATLEGSSYLNVADAAVALYHGVGGSSGALTPRYLRSLTRERTWIESAANPDRPDGPSIIRFRHADLRSAVLALTWFELDGARDKIFAWLTKLAEHTDVEVRVRAAGSVGILATTDFQHALHNCFLRWGASRSPKLRQAAALGLNVAGRLGGLAEQVWYQIEAWADIVHDDSRVRHLPTTAALAVGGPLGADDPRRALRLLRTLVCEGAWDFIEAAALSTEALLQAGRCDEVVEALADWTATPASDDAVTKALMLFAFAAQATGPTGTEHRLPALLTTARKHRENMPRLWSRALADPMVAPLAQDSLRTWVLAAGADQVAEQDLTDMVAGIADLDEQNYQRMSHLMLTWADDPSEPSGTAAEIYELLVEDGS